MADVSFYDPKLASEAKRRRLFAEQLMKTSAQPTQTEMVGGHAVVQSPVAAMARALQGGLGQYQAAQADNLDSQAQAQQGKLLAAALSEKDPRAAASMLVQDPTLASSGISLYGTAIKGEQDIAQQALKDAREDAKWEKDANLKRELQASRTGGYIDPETGEIVAGQPKLSSTDTKELYDTIDTVNQTEGSLNSLRAARNLLDGKNAAGEATAVPYSGLGAETRTDLARWPDWMVPDAIADADRATSTTDYGNLVTGQALQGMKAAFGANPTEGERKVLLDLQALPNKTQPEQRRILENAEIVLANRLEFNKRKAKDIESGNRAGLVNFKDSKSNGTQSGWSIEEVQ